MSGLCLCRAWPGTRHDQQKAPRHSGLEPESSLEQRRVPDRAWPGTRHDQQQTRPLAQNPCPKTKKAPMKTTGAELVRGGGTK
ncbi:hypothetical protein [Thiohalophilus sp.]|uniref:hypothetical protein n=1 Tax=Thiohalophilus sp. TaxID=3028392 RepID=UPI003974AED8